MYGSPQLQAHLGSEQSEPYQNENIQVIGAPIDKEGRT
jgi:hypothetical protein